MSKGNMPASEADVKPLETLISEASSEIDRAVTKGIMHKNTAARRKSRLGRTKRRLLISAGLYTPAEDSADYQFYLQQQQKSA
jgi:small subunit ribosomal protein S20